MCNIALCKKETCYCHDYIVHVVNSACCFFSTQTDKAVLGITDLLPGTEGGTQISVKAVYFYTNFGGFPPSNDISLLELEIPVETGTIMGEITFLVQNLYLEFHCKEA